MSFQRITIMGTTTHIAGMAITIDTTRMAIIMAIDTIDMDITIIGNGSGMMGWMSEQRLVPLESLSFVN